MRGSCYNVFRKRQQGLISFCFLWIIILNLSMTSTNSKTRFKKSNLVNNGVMMPGRIKRDYKKNLLFDKTKIKCSFGKHYHSKKCISNSQHCLKYDKKSGNCYSCQLFTLLRSNNIKKNDISSKDINVQTGSYCETTWPLMGFCLGLIFTIIFQIFWFICNYTTWCDSQETNNSNTKKTTFTHNPYSI